MLLRCNFRSYSKVHRESTNGNRCIDLIPESSINSVKTMVDYQNREVQIICLSF